VVADPSSIPSSNAIVLVRHGDTEWSRAGRHTSVTDVVLTDAGREGARAVGARLAAMNVVAGDVLVLTSPLARARETCDLAGFGARAEVDADLREWEYGQYEGLTTATIRERIPDWTIFTHGAPGGETAAEVGVRADRVIARVAAAGTAVIFSHGHFLRVLGARWMGLPPTDGRLLALDTATLSVLGCEREQRVLRSWNAR
jgi:broad specificity phosphatase PhoE